MKGILKLENGKEVPCRFSLQVPRYKSQAGKGVRHRFERAFRMN